MPEEKTLDDTTPDNSLLNDDIVINDDSNNTDLDLQPENNASNMYRLPSGNALSLEDSYIVTGAEKTKLVVLVGPQACGKTTIETTIYQMFHDGKLNGYCFAGSRTLQAFERRSFHTRIDSNQDLPTTPRTPRSVQEIFLHLKLYDKVSKQYVNFLFADLSGEDFEANRADITLMRNSFEFIKYADYIVAVIDGDRISTKKYRNSTLDSIGELLRTLLEAHLYNCKTNFQILVSKYDIVAERINTDENIKNFIDGLNTELLNRLGTHLSSIDRYDVAAMPTTTSNGYTIGHGIKELMASWCLGLPHQRTFEFRVEHASIKSEFNKLSWKITGDKYE